MMNIKRIGVLLIILIIFVVVLLGIMFIFRERRIDVHEIGSLELNYAPVKETFVNQTIEITIERLNIIEKNHEYKDNKELQEIKEIIENQNADTNIVISCGRRLKYITYYEETGLTYYFGEYEENEEDKYFFYTVDYGRMSNFDGTF